MRDPLTRHVKQAIGKLRRQPVVQRLRERHPRLVQFAIDRFATSEFVGLPLTLIFLAFVGNSLLLSELTESVLDAEWIVTLDKKFTAMLYKMRSDALSQLLYGFTQLGEREAVFWIGGLVSALFLYHRRYITLFSFWFMMAGVGLSTRYSKTFISRERPEDVAYYAVEHFSFPSGHATTVIALYGLLAYITYRHYHQHPYREVLLWLAGILIILVGFSRIYLGVHYLSDVLAGFLLGGLWLLVGISLVEVLAYHRKKRRNVKY
ncbi:phosphatase PAP2 family protein [Pontibacter sp. CAU 1760]